MKPPLLLSLTVLTPALVSAQTLTPGNGRFEFHLSGKSIPVWYFLPESATPEAPVVFVMHGVGRDAERYRKDWAPHAQKYGFVLVVPEFSRTEFPKDSDYAQGGTIDDSGRWRTSEHWAFSAIEPIFDVVKTGSGNHTDKYRLFGHSAGAQFVHRFLYLVPNARVSQIVAANAGWWTLPDLTTDYPYGLKGIPDMTQQRLSSALGRPLIVLLGTNDTDPHDPHLNRSAGAMAQGPHRFSRGNYFYLCGQSRAAELETPFGWKLGTAPGIGHTDAGMSSFAVECLFGSKSSPH